MWKLYSFISAEKKFGVHFNFKESSKNALILNVLTNIYKILVLQSKSCKQYVNMLFCWITIDWSVCDQETNSTLLT